MKKTIIVFFLLFINFFLFSQNVDEYKNYHEYGRELLLQGLYNEAIIQLDSAIAMMPYGSEMYYERGYSKMQLKKYKESILDFSMVINKTPHKYHAYISRAIARYHIDNFYGAKQDLKKALSKDPENLIAKEYLEIVENSLREITQQNNQQTYHSIHQKQTELQNTRYERRRKREQVIWGTVIPIAFWTSVFLTW